jgi:molecular chaperone DnaK
VNVSAKDKATGKEQSIQITASSGLSKDEIDKLVKDAEMHVEEDRKKRELVDARNQADQLIYSTEKSIKDLGDKVDKATRTKVEDAIANLRKVMDSDDKDQIQRASEELTNASHKLAEAMYQQASQAEGQKAGAQQQQQAGGGARASKPDEDVVDADFEEVKDDKK